jgi:hypothetical protein
VEIISCNKRKSRHSINFIDRYDVFVGYDFTSSCCEQFGYYFILPNGTQTDDDLEESPLKGFVFDPSFIEQGQYGTDAGGFAKFRLVKGDKEAFLVIYNDHNGYYSHGFIFKAEESSESVDHDDFFYAKVHIEDSI